MSLRSADFGLLALTGFPAIERARKCSAKGLPRWSRKRDLKYQSVQTRSFSRDLVEGGLLSGVGTAPLCSHWRPLLADLLDSPGGIGRTLVRGAGALRRRPA